MELLSGIMMFIQVAARPYSHQHEGMDSGDPDQETCRVYSLLFEYSLIGGYSVMPVHCRSPSKQNLFTVAKPRLARPAQRWLPTHSVAVITVAGFTVRACVGGSLSSGCMTLRVGTVWH